MNGSSKGVLVVVLIAIAGAVGYYIYDEKKKKAALGGDSSKQLDSNIITDVTKPIIDAAKSVAGIATGKSQVKLTSANDVLSADIKAANGKQLWSTSDVATVYNMANQPAAKTTKNQFLGIVLSARTVPVGGFIITFLGTSKTQYWITSGGVAIKM